MSDPADNRITTPFSAEEVVGLAYYQACGLFHPYTCCDGEVMAVGQGGLVCYDCGEVRTWALKSSADIGRKSATDPRFRLTLQGGGGESTIKVGEG